MNSKVESIYLLMLEFMYDNTWQEISEEFLNYLSRLRLIDDAQFNELAPKGKLRLLLDLNEDQITNRASELFTRLSEEDFTKNDLSEAVELLKQRGIENEEMIICTPIQLSDQARKVITKIIGDKIKNNVRIVFKVDEEIVLGCRIEYKNRVQDYSLTNTSLPFINSQLNKIS